MSTKKMNSFSKECENSFLVSNTATTPKTTPFQTGQLKHSPGRKRRKTHSFERRGTLKFYRCWFVGTFQGTNLITTIETNFNLHSLYDLIAYIRIYLTGFINNCNCCCQLVSSVSPAASGPDCELGVVLRERMGLAQPLSMLTSVEISATQYRNDLDTGIINLVCSHSVDTFLAFYSRWSALK